MFTDLVWREDLSLAFAASQGAPTDCFGQLEILFYGIPLPNPNILFTNLLPARSKISVPEYLSAEPTCTLLKVDKGFNETGTAGEEALPLFSLFLY